MSTEQQATSQAEVEVETLAPQSILERAISATAQTPADTTKELLSIMTSQVMEGTVTWNKNLTLTIEQAVAEIDRKISEQLSAVMKNPNFQKLEGSWLGLQKWLKTATLVLI